MSGIKLESGFSAVFPRCRSPQVRERGPEGWRYPGVHPVGPPRHPRGLRQIPGLAGFTTGTAKPLVHGDRGSARCMRPETSTTALPEEAADPAEAVAVDVQRAPACVDSGDHCGHALPLLARR